jgi:ketosteroid isomerase-like protein
VTPQLTRDYLERGGAALEGSTAPPTGFNGGSLALSDVVGPLTGRHTVGDIHQAPSPTRDTARAMDGRDVAMIDALRRTYEAFNRGDFDAAVEFAHPEMEFIPPGGQASLRGAAAVRAWMEPDAFEEQRIEPLDFRVEGKKVLVRQHAQARGAGSGIELDLEVWAVWTFDDGLLITRVESYLPHQESEALEAAGISE